jgi:hypothetical protein
MGKPPSSRHVVPRRGTSDYDAEEATTLDPFVIHDSELVVVPKTAGTDAIREDLHADPDVQDALRWLDPPSNAGPPVAAAEGAPPPEGAMVAYVPPVRHPSSPPYAQVYTPVPQAYPGSGPYPTPVPNYVPNSGAYYLATPMPGAASLPPQPVASARSPVLWIILTALVTGGGIALGWWLFAGRYQWSGEHPPAARGAPPAPRAAEQTPAPQPGAPPTASQPQPSAPAPALQPQLSAPQPAEPQPQPAAPAPDAAAVTAEVVSMQQARSVSVASPVSGEVSKVFLAKPGKVAKGDKLLEVRHETGGGAKAKKLAARVAELEKLAKDDPVYEEFLADARKELKSARGRSESMLIKATGAGTARVTVKEGESVAGGKPVAVISEGGDWTIKATAQSDVQRSWSCNLELPDGQRAPCTIDKVVASASGSNLTVKVKSADAPWLEDMAQKPALALAPAP